MLNIISSSLQFTASVILMVWCLKGASKKEIIIKYFHGDNYIHTFDDGNCVLEKKRLQCTAKKVYLNIYALFLLSVGYFVSFTNIEIVTDISNLELACIILIGGYMFGELITEFIASHIYNEDIVINYKELSKFVSVHTNVTITEIDNMFKE